MLQFAPAVRALAAWPARSAAWAPSQLAATPLCPRPTARRAPWAPQRLQPVQLATCSVECTRNWFWVDVVESRFSTIPFFPTAPSSLVLPLCHYHAIGKHGLGASSEEVDSTIAEEANRVLGIIKEAVDVGTLPGMSSFRELVNAADSKTGRRLSLAPASMPQGVDWSTALTAWDLAYQESASPAAWRASLAMGAPTSATSLQDPVFTLRGKLLPVQDQGMAKLCMLGPIWAACMHIGACHVGVVS
jgi:hypothetical protein